LATEADEADATTSAVSAHRVRAKIADEAVVEEPPLSGAAADLSLARIVPNSLWFHALLSLAGFLFSGALVAAGVWLARVESYAGLGARMLFAPGAGSAVRWTASMELVLVGQLGLVVWWIRSHSLKDFGGRYHLWRRVAVAAVLWSFALSTGCHTWAGQALAARLSWKFEDAGTVAWMGPALLAGVTLVWGLHREMSACRASLAFVQAASLAGFAYVLIDLRLVPLPADWRPHTASILDGIVLASVWLLATGSLLHARFVVHQNAEPSSTPRWRLRIPRPHFRMFRSHRRPAAETKRSAELEPVKSTAKPEAPKTRGVKPESSEAEVEQPSEPRATKLPFTEREPSRRTSEASGERPVDSRRPDSRQAESRPQVDAPSTSPTSGTRPVLQESPAPRRDIPAQPQKPAVFERAPRSPEPVVPQASNLDLSAPEPSASQPTRGFNATSALFSAPPTDDEKDDENGEDPADSTNDGRFQGLSKKQRRKLQAKERSQRDR
jgi:hypothetical protein